MFFLIIAIPLFAALGLGFISFNLFAMEMTAPAVLLGSLSLGFFILTAYVPKLCKG